MTATRNAPRAPAPLQEQVYLELLRTVSALSHQADAFFREFGITQPQYNVLRILRGAGPAGLGRNEIADRMLTVTPDMSRMLDRMEHAGWITRARSIADRRQVSTVLHTAGLALLTRIEKPLHALQQQLFAACQETDLRQLLSLLRQVSTK